MKFSLAELFWLTFWFAILLSLWRFIVFVGRSIPLTDHVELMFAVSLLMSVVAALGAINGRPKTGAAIGILVAMLAVARIVLNTNPQPSKTTRHQRTSRTSE